MNFKLLCIILFYLDIIKTNKEMCANSSLNIKSPIDLKLPLLYNEFKVVTNFKDNVDYEIIKLKKNHLRILGEFGSIDYSEENKKSGNYKITDLNLYTPSLHGFLGSKFLFELHINAKTEDNKLLTNIILFQEKKDDNYHSNFLNNLGFKTGNLKKMNIGDKIKNKNKINLNSSFGKNKYFINYEGNRPEINWIKNENCKKNTYLFSTETIYINNSYLDELGANFLNTFSYKPNANIIVKQNKNKPKPKKKKNNKKPKSKPIKKDNNGKNDKNSKDKNDKNPKDIKDKNPKDINGKNPKEDNGKNPKDIKEKDKKYTNKSYNKEKEKEKQEIKKIEKKKNPKVLYVNNKNITKPAIYVYSPKKTKNSPKEIFVTNPNENQIKNKPKEIFIDTLPPNDNKLDNNNGNIDIKDYPKIIYLNKPLLDKSIIKNPEIIYLNKPIYKSKNLNEIQVIFLNNPGYKSNDYNPKIIYKHIPTILLKKYPFNIINPIKIPQFKPLKLTSKNIHLIKVLNIKHKIIWNENVGYYPPNAIKFWQLNFKSIINKFKPFPKETIAYKYIPYYLYPFNYTNYYTPVFIKVPTFYKIPKKLPKTIPIFVNIYKNKKLKLKKINIRPKKKFNLNKILDKNIKNQSKFLKIKKIIKPEKNKKIKIIASPTGEYKIIKICKKKALGLVLNRFYLNNKQWGNKFNDLYSFHNCRKFKRIKIPILHYKKFLKTHGKKGKLSQKMIHSLFNKKKILCNIDLQVILNLNKKNKKFIKEYVDKICKKYKNDKVISVTNKIETLDKYEKDKINKEK